MFFFSSRRRHTRYWRDWSSDVCSSDLAPHLALARSDRFYELGEYLRERGPEILQAAQDPANLMLGGTTMAGGLAVALAAPKLAGGCWRHLHKALYADPGGVLLGTTKGRWSITRPVYLSLADRLMHLQVVAPTGGAKTSLFEWIFCQDLKSDLTTISVENVGDFGARAVSRALLAGKPVYRFDPTVKNTLKWNPLAGEPEEADPRRYLRRLLPDLLLSRRPLRHRHHDGG